MKPQGDTPGISRALLPSSSLTLRLFWLFLRIAVALLCAERGSHFVYQGF